MRASSFGSCLESLARSPWGTSRANLVAGVSVLRHRGQPYNQAAARCLNVPLDRDAIFVAEAGEKAAPR